MIEFEWDEARNHANSRKHGIDFETAKRIFNGPMLTWRDHRKNYGEERDLGIGRLNHEGVIVVAWTNRVLESYVRARLRAIDLAVRVGPASA